MSLKSWEFASAIRNTNKCKNPLNIMVRSTFVSNSNYIHRELIMHTTPPYHSFLSHKLPRSVQIEINRNSSRIAQIIRLHRFIRLSGAVTCTPTKLEKKYSPIHLFYVRTWRTHINTHIQEKTIRIYYCVIRSYAETA